MQQKGKNLGLQLKLELQSMLLQKELYDFLIKETLSFFPRLLALVRFQTFLPLKELALGENTKPLSFHC